MTNLIENTAILGQRTLHILYDSEGHDINFGTLDIGDQSSDDQVKDAVANFFTIPSEKLRFFAVDRHENGNMTVRPQAVFG